MAGLIAIFTILGGIAGVWFIYDKLRVKDWSRFRRRLTAFKRSRRQAANSPVVEERSWPIGAVPQFPDHVKTAVSFHLSEYRLPNEADILGDWALFGDPTTLFPILCRGNFSGAGEQCCCFVISKSGPGYKLIVFPKNSSDKPIELTSGDTPPQKLFAQTIRPGKYLTMRGKEYGLKMDPTIPKILHLRRDGIDYGRFESFDGIFYWCPRKGTFDYVPMSD